MRRRSGFRTKTTRQDTRLRHVRQSVWRSVGVHYEACSASTSRLSACRDGNMKAAHVTFHSIHPRTAHRTLSHSGCFYRQSGHAACPLPTGMRVVTAVERFSTDTYTQHVHPHSSTVRHSSFVFTLINTLVFSRYFLVSSRSFVRSLARYILLVTSRQDVSYHVSTRP